MVQADLSDDLALLKLVSKREELGVMPRFPTRKAGVGGHGQSE